MSLQDSLRSLLDIPLLPLVHIFSYLNIEYGENIDVSLTCRLFYNLAKPYREKYFEKCDYYTNTFLSPIEAREVIKTYPHIRVCVKAGSAIYVDTESLEKEFKGHLYRLQTQTTTCYTLRTYDTKGNLHSYGDRPAILSHHEYGTIKEWCEHGKLHRENDEPAKKKVYYFYPRANKKVWYRHGIKYQKK